MKAKIIEIGNSKGLRIPKTLLEQLGIKEEVSLEISSNGLLIKPVGGARFDWAQAFMEMTRRNDDGLLDPNSTSEWDEKEWKWK
jgi:antitoxin MazE